MPAKGRASRLAAGIGPVGPRLAGYTSDDRNAFALLLLPLMLVAASVAASHAMRRTVSVAPVMSAGAAAHVPSLPSPVAMVVVPEHRQNVPDDVQWVAHADPQAPSRGGEPGPIATAVPAEPALPAIAEPPPNEAEVEAALSVRPGAQVPISEAADFGLRLAAAAFAQSRDAVTYTARYQTIAYPMGDISPAEGACTDVVIRAYRALGVDLQELVQRARVGIGDPSIDHRRTETLRKFFERHSASLPVTPYPEDYLPGDIVTYYRPFSRVSRAHIAIVSEMLAATGRPMIVHNRGFGVQLEDALFVDRITGHYRFAGPHAVEAARQPDPPGARHVVLVRP